MVELKTIYRLVRSQFKEFQDSNYSHKGRSARFRNEMSILRISDRSRIAKGPTGQTASLETLPRAT